MGVNSSVFRGQRPSFSQMGGDRTAALLSGDLAGFGANVPIPTSHAGRIANKVGARLLWARRPIQIRASSPDGQGPYVWRIYAEERARPGVMRVLKDVVAEVGQGSAAIAVREDPGAAYDIQRWWLEFTPPQRGAPSEAAADTPSALAGPGMSRDWRRKHPSLGQSAAIVGWAPMKAIDAGPPGWRSTGRPDVPGYAGDLGLPPDPGAPLPGSVATKEAGVERAVGNVIRAFQSEGTEAGMRRARVLGPAYVEGARAWISHRSSHEEQLARAVARERTYLVRHRGRHRGRCVDCEAALMRLRFLEARLSEVRSAQQNAATPPQAVADKPDVVSTRIPKWVTYGGLMLAAIGFLRRAK